MSGERLAALLGIALLLTACGGRSTGPSGNPRPAPSAAGRSPALPSRLELRAGELFTAVVSFDERDEGPVDDAFSFLAHERFRVVRVRAGVATVRVAVVSWRWRRNTSALLTASLPGPATFGVDARARIVSGVDWPLPSQLPLPGLDVFAAPIASSGGWSRTDGEGVELSYQARGAAVAGATTLDWSVSRPGFTRTGDPITVNGGAEATVSSRYLHGGPAITLRSTFERVSFERTTRSAAGTTEEAGTVLETTTFSFP